MIKLFSKKSGLLYLSFALFFSFIFPHSAFATNPVLAIAFEGTDGQNTYTAETGQTITFVGDAQLDTGVILNGTSSLLLDDVGDYCTSPYEAWMNIGSGDFTIQGYMYPHTQSLQILISTEGIAPGMWFNGATNMAFYFDSSTARSWTTTSRSNNVKYHWCFERYGNNLYYYQNGVSQGTKDVTGLTISNASYTWNIGYWSSWGTFDGSLDSVEVNTYAKYQGNNFTPPTTEWGIGQRRVILIQ